MADKTFYAIVDLETTGSQPDKGDRIIQFGCVLVQDGQVVQKFETKLNPLKKIPENIQYLTGITNKMVANEPFFNDVSGFIWNLLQDCVFVAHNVLFDYRFLNEELKKAGYPSLECPAIDTVELAQILFPKEESYSLSDISESLGYAHENPHDALGDAEATADLLLKLLEKAKKLPLVTLERLLDFSNQLTMETSLFFEKVLEQVKDNPMDLPEDLMIAEGIVLRKQTSAYTDSYREEKSYPIQVSEKEKLFEGKLSVRMDQQEMMDSIYQYFLESAPDYHLAIEAPAGVGKSLGYLLPSVFLASPERPVVFSTYTTLLQQQLLEKDLNELRPYLPFSVSSAVLKSRSHYLSLAKFSDKLNSGSIEKIEALYSSKILVWLTETNTGDMDELGTINDRHPFWTEIRTTISPEQLQKSKWEAYDFYRLSRKKVKEASLIVTNHSFLCHDLVKETSELPMIEKVVIDEAHHLPKAATQAAQKIFHFSKVKKLLQKIGSKENEKSLICQLSALLSEKNLPAKNLNTLEANRLYLESELEDWIENWLFEYRKEAARLKEKNEQIDISIDMSQLSVQMKKQAKTIRILMEEIVYIMNRNLESLLEADRKWRRSDQTKLEEAYVTIEEFAEQFSLLKEIILKSDGEGLYWISFKDKYPAGSLRIIRYEPESRKFLENTLGGIPHVVYTSGTLSVNNQFSFFENQLGTNKLKKVQLNVPYDYENQARVWVPEDLASIKGKSKQDYVDMLTHYILSICQYTEENTLILFNSLETLERVYAQLHQASQLKGREIFAQGVSGSRERILKRFFRAKGALLLGADSFWEGIDLPGKSLSMVIVTRLPFESPDRPLVKARQQFLKSQNRNPFTEDSLPRAILKLKQGFGRLIRSREDKGVLFILDDRFLYAKYGAQFQQALPSNVKIETIDVKDAATKIEQFFTE